MTIVLDLPKQKSNRYDLMVWNKDQVVELCVRLVEVVSLLSLPDFDIVQLLY